MRLAEFQQKRSAQDPFGNFIARYVFTEKARRLSIEVDMVAGIPDSGIAHAVGYASESGVPYRRPFVKYTPTWPRSFMPQSQEVRDLRLAQRMAQAQEAANNKAPAE